MIKAIAYDWSVNIRAEGSGHANSGFQIIVEEMDSLQLREKRAQTFQAGFRRLYKILQLLYPTLPAGELRVRWAPPSLPVNTSEMESMWQLRIAGGRASVLDYLREVKGMDDETAMEKIQEIIQIDLLLGQTVKVTGANMADAASPPAAGATSQPSSAGGNPTGNP
jgi:hypothetical protein